VKTCYMMCLAAYKRGNVVQDEPEEPEGSEEEKQAESEDDEQAASFRPVRTRRTPERLDFTVIRLPTDAQTLLFVIK
jgi:hypothetical protein